jgi:hypothetical protein
LMLSLIVSWIFFSSIASFKLFNLIISVLSIDFEACSQRTTKKRCSTE